MSPNNALHSDGPRVARPAGERGRYAAFSVRGYMRISFVLFALFASAAVTAADSPHAVTPPEGLVPNKETTIRIAVAVWEPIYGVKTIAEQKPYTARLEKGVWIVEGSVHTEIGGAAIAEIAKSDGRILRVSHGR